MPDEIKTEKKWSVSVVFAEVDAYAEDHPPFEKGDILDYCHEEDRMVYIVDTEEEAEELIDRIMALDLYKRLSKNMGIKDRTIWLEIYVEDEYGYEKALETYPASMLSDALEQIRRILTGEEADNHFDSGPAVEVNLCAWNMEGTVEGPYPKVLRAWPIPQRDVEVAHG